MRMKRLLRYIIALMVGLVTGIGAESPAYAHGFGQRYDLPLPLWLYLLGAGATVVVSFVVIGVFVRGTAEDHNYARINLLHRPIGRVLTSPALLLFVRIASVVLFVLVVVAGLIGMQEPTQNLAPTIVWVIWWVGLAYICALLGNVWAVINPWKISFEWAEQLYRRITSATHLSLQRSYPEWLGVWPAFVLFLGFAWVELVYPDAAQPRTLAVLILVYSLVTWTGMLVFGKHVWLRNGGPFSLVFGYLARFAPTEVRVASPDVCARCTATCRDRSGQCINCFECFERADDDQRELNLRPYAAGLLRNERVRPSQVAFVLLMLATVTFDGFLSTPAWAAIVRGSASLFSFLGSSAQAGIASVGLVVFATLFALIYMNFTTLMDVVTGGERGAEVLARIFAYSLIPIALAYHLAHYLTFLLIQGQLLIPLASDPFGFGWNLFGTRGYDINIAIVDARFAWFIAVAAIVLGHIIAVYIAHVVALRTFEDRRPAIKSQYPMLVLMVVYTVVSLWILSQPIVET